MPKFTKETASAMGKLRARQFTPASQSKAGQARAKLFTPQHQSDAGKKGAAVVLQKYGRETLFKHIVNTRKNHATPGEKRVASILDQLGLAFEFNAPLEGKWIVDFLLPDGKVIEFNGTIHQSPVYDTARHLAKVNGLRAMGFAVLEIDDSQLSQAADMIREFLGVTY